MPSRREALLRASLLVTLVPAARALSQPASTLKGIVVTGEGSPVKGATVKAGAAGTATTDGGGLFTMKVKPGSYSVVVSQKGFKPETIPVTLAPGEVKDIASILTK